MNEITIEIKDLNIVDNELSDIDDNSLRLLSGSGPITGLAAAFTTTLGIGLYGLSEGQSTQSVWKQQVIFEGTAFVGGFFTPSP